jgi:hypothetical protein
MTREKIICNNCDDDDDDGDNDDNNNNEGTEFRNWSKYEGLVYLKTYQLLDGLCSLRNVNMRDLLTNRISRKQYYYTTQKQIKTNKRKFIGCE